MQTVRMHGQISTELLIIMGFMLLLLLPLLLYSYGRVSITNEDIAAQKAVAAASRLAHLSDSVGYLGGAAAIVEEVEMPPNLKSVKVSGHDIIILVDSSAGTKQIVKTSAFNLNSSGLENITHAGTYFIQISALSAGSGAQVMLELK